MPGLAEKVKQIPAGIDMGNSCITVAIACDYGSCIPAAVASCPTIGMRRGVITDADGLVHCMAEALRKAEKAAGMKVSAVRVGFTGYTAELASAASGFSAGRVRRVSRSDLERLQRLAAAADIHSGRQILKIIPVEYTVDSYSGIKEPLGLKFKTLGLTAGVLTADSKLIDSITSILFRLSLQPLTFIPSTLAAAGAVLTSTEMHLGAAVVDLGAVSTGVAVYNHGTQLGFTLLPIGGEHITGDLAVGLRTTLEAAGEVKLKIGIDAKTNLENYEVPGINNTGSHEIKSSFAREIAEARVCDILDLVRAAVENMTGGASLSGGLVLTGGGAALKGLGEYAAEYVGIPVRIAYSGVSSPAGKAAQDCSFTAAVGLLQNVDDIFCTGDSWRRDMWKSIKEFLGNTRHE
jgi:cell division protein FtsA